MNPGTRDARGWSEKQLREELEKLEAELAAGEMSFRGITRLEHLRWLAEKFDRAKEEAHEQRIARALDYLTGRKSIQE